MPTTTAVEEPSAELFCDPLAVGMWRCRPTLEHVAYAFPEVHWVVRPLVAVPEPRQNEAASEYATAARRAASAANLPVAEQLFETGVPASWPVCEALVAARSLAPDRALELLHRLTARVFAEGVPPTTPADIAAVTADIDGLDESFVRDAVGSRRATAALGRDLEIGRALLARRDEQEVRGTIDTVPLRPRLLDDGPVHPASIEESSDEDDHEGVEDETDSDRETMEEADEPRIPAPPVVRIHAGAYTTVVDPRRGFDEFVDVLRRYDPDLGELDWSAKIHGRHAMQAYGMPQHTAETLSGEQYTTKMADVLSGGTELFVADIAACADLDPTTCRLALGRLRVDGEIVRTDAGGWRTVSNQVE